MKKILSFLQKKPLAIAAVALMSMTSYAQDATTGADGGATKPEKELTPVNIWQKVCETNPLYYFDMVTVVDEDENKVYADDGTNQVDAKDFLAKDEDGNFVPGTTVPEDASFFYVAEGSSSDFFALNKSLKKNADGKYVNKAGEVVSDEDVAVGKDGKGAMGDGLYLHETGDLKSSSLWSTVSWKWEDMTGSSEYYLFSAANFDRFIAYNSVAKRFEYSPDADNSPKAKLYKAVKKYLPYFNPEEGVVKNPEKGWGVEIVNPNPDGTVWYREKGDDEWTEYTGLIPVEKLDEEITFETYIEFEGGSTGTVEATYLLTNIAAPDITPESGTPEKNTDGELKVDKNGEALVDITSEEGTTVSYKYDTTEKEGTSNEEVVDFASYANPAEGETNEVTVTATASKTVTFKGKEEPVVSDPTEVTYTVVPNATPEDLELALEANPVNGSEVSGGDVIALWWTINNDEYSYYTLAPNPEKTKEIKLTFHTADGNVEEIVKDEDVAINKDGQFVFRTPNKPEYYNTEFDVEVVEGFYLATSGANVIETPEDIVMYTMGPGKTVFTVDTDPTPMKWNETRIQPTDEKSYVVQIYPGSDENAVTDFANPVQDESNYGAWLAMAQDELAATIQKVEKVAEPNFFEITFTDDEALQDAIVYYLENLDTMIGGAGYSVGFPVGTFKSGEYVNKEDVTHHVKFVESVDLKIHPLAWTRCEGSQGVEVFVEAKGKVLGTDFNVPFGSDEESQIVVDPEAVVTVTGTDIHGNDVNVSATIEVARESLQEKWGSKDVFYLTYGQFTLQEDGGDGTKDGNKPYLVSISKGAFKVNLSSTDAFEGKLDVMAHPVWTATARPYTYEDPEVGATTLTLDLTATLNDLKEETDDHVKLFERDVEVFDPETKITVDGVPAKWTLVPGSVTTPDYDEDDRPYENFVVTLELAEPITDVKEHKIVIGASAFIVNACDNDVIELNVQPYVKYEIQKVKYIIPYTQKSVTYDIWGILPDGSRVEAPIDYVGETDADVRNIYNALRYNNAQFKELDETLAPGEAYVSEKDAFYPKVESTVYNEEEKSTTFTISFPEGLVVNQYKMTFPAGTVQAQGYNESDARLYNAFDVVQAYFYDATSSEEDYKKPAETPKKKVYNISTSTKEITLYLTAADLAEDAVTGNANADILLLDGTQLTVENEKIDEVVAWKHEEAGIFTVTLPKKSENGGLEEGTYTLTVPALSVTTNKIFSVVETPTPGLYNSEAFELTINVEDFAGPEDAIKITTKTYAFDVKVSDEAVTVIKDEEGNAPVVQLGGAEATLENSDNEEPGYVRVVLPVTEKNECKPFMECPDQTPENVLRAVKDAAEETAAEAEPKMAYFFMHSCQEPADEPAPYPLVIPAGSFEGKYATNYEDIEAEVNVIFEFIDSGTGITDDLETPNDLTTTVCEVIEETYVQKEMLFTRSFRNQNMQALAVPFDIKQSEVAEYFTIYRLNMVWENTEGIQLNYVSIGEDGIAYANKPYIIVPTAKAVEETKASETGAVSITFEDKEVVFPMMSFINCATTKVHYQFFNTLFKQKFDADMVDEFGWKTLSGGEIANISASGLLAWRWWIAPSDKFGNYVKIALDGFVQDDADGIDFVQAAEGDNTIYNVAGQKLNAPAKGKVNIINGKKVFVK